MDSTQRTEAERAVVPPSGPDQALLDEPVFGAMAPIANGRSLQLGARTAGLQDTAGRRSTQDAVTELLEGTPEGALLLRALACPAMDTMIRIPGKTADRVATVLRDALRRAVESQLAYVKKPTVVGRAEAATAHRWLWVLPTLLLRAPPSDEQTDESTKAAGARKRETIVTDRVKLMETDRAVDLAELENPPCRQNQNPLPAWTEAQQKHCGRWP